jgi:predicted metal-dependent hydrolase
MGPGGPQGMQQPPGGENEGAEEKGKLGDYGMWLKDNVLALGLNLHLTTAQYKQVQTGLETLGIAIRSMAAVSDRRAHIHELAAAMQAYLEKEGHFPRGAVPRAPDAHRVLDWRPDQRLSWMTEILPYLSNGEFQDIKASLKTDKAWYEEPNDKAGMALIPQFLAPSPSEEFDDFYVEYPNIPVKGFNNWAVTHFVGIAGLGLDAAEYRAGDPATAKKRGVFGYDRETKKEDIKDGLEQTIVVIQAPPEPKAPWIAGGGSTVRGISEDLDCVKPFVCTEYQGKRGTFAIMADGKVRFIPATIDPKTFQALCTIAGGEKVRNLDNIAPEVPPPEDLPQSELKAEEPAPAASPAAKPAEAAAPSKVPAGWQEIVSKEGRYRVAMPAGPVQENTLKLPVPGGGEIAVHMKILALPQNAGVYMVYYADASGALKDVDTELEEFRKGLLNSLQGSRATNEKKITLAGRPGREFQVDVTGKGSLMVRVYLDKNRFYALIAGGPPGKVAATDIQAFFDSFQITAP